MTKQELLDKLNEIREKQEEVGVTREEDHINADGLLLDFIDDEDVRAAFLDIRKWYA